MCVKRFGPAKEERSGPYCPVAALNRATSSAGTSPRSFTWMSCALAHSWTAVLSTPPAAARRPPPTGRRVPPRPSVQLAHSEPPHPTRLGLLGGDRRGPAAGRARLGQGSPARRRGPRRCPQRTRRARGCHQRRVVNGARGHARLTLLLLPRPRREHVGDPEEYKRG